MMQYLLNPLFLGLLIILFLAGRFLGKLTKRPNIWKLLLLGYFALFLIAPVRDAGPFIGGVFILGFLSNQFGLLLSIIAWAEDLADIYFAFKYRQAYEDIRDWEEDLREREARMRASEARQQSQGSGHQANWQQEAKGFRRKPRGDASANQGAKQKTSGQKKTSGSQQKQKSRSQSAPPREGLRAQHLQTLGLDPTGDYNPDEIKRAYRKMAKKTHPDAGGSHAGFIAVQNAYEWLMGLIWCLDEVVAHTAG